MPPRGAGRPDRGRRAGTSNEIIERDLIYKHLWGPTMVRNDRSVDVFVHKVRRKLERASPRWRYIHTHWGVGYRFAAEPVEDSEVTPRQLAPLAGPEELVNEPASTR